MRTIPFVYLLDIDLPEHLSARRSCWGEIGTCTALSARPGRRGEIETRLAAAGGSLEAILRHDPAFVSCPLVDRFTILRPIGKEKALPRGTPFFSAPFSFF